MALFVIYGNQNSGKTHTCWLIHALLKNAGKRLNYSTHSAQPDWTYSEVLQHIEDRFHAPQTTPNASDFWALFEYKGKRIAIFSAGDYLHDDNWDITSFDDNLKWAEQNQIDHVICCTRSRKKANSTRKHVLDNYRLHVYRWYEKTATTVLAEQIADAQRIAIEVFTDIKENC